MTVVFRCRLTNIFDILQPALASKIIKILNYLLKVLLNLIYLINFYFRYGSCASAKDFEIYAPNATFEDPLMRAEG